MKKKLTALVLAVLTAVALLPHSAFAASFQIDFETSCDALLLVNLDTNTAVYEKNADKRREPASLTKIMTYIVVDENVPDPDNTTVTISQKIQDELLEEMSLGRMVVKSSWGTRSSLSWFQANSRSISVTASSVVAMVRKPRLLKAHSYRFLLSAASPWTVIRFPASSTMGEPRAMHR